MELAYAEAFVAASKFVFKEMGAIDVKVKGKSQPNLKEYLGGAAISANITGDISGRMELRLTKDFLYKAAQHIAIHSLETELNVEEDEETLFAIVMEICNQITGQALTQLSLRNLNCDLSTPDVRMMNEPGGALPQYQLSTRMVSDQGWFDLILSSRETESVEAQPRMLLVNLPMSLADTIAKRMILLGIDTHASQTYGDTEDLMSIQPYDFVVIDIDRLSVDFNQVVEQLLKRSKNRAPHWIIMSARRTESILQRLGSVAIAGTLGKHDSDRQLLDSLYQILRDSGFNLRAARRNIRLHLRSNEHYSDFHHPLTGDIRRVSVIDLSAVGIACELAGSQDPTLKEGLPIRSFHLHLSGSGYINVSGKLARVDPHARRFIMLFDALDIRVKEEIASFIFQRSDSNRMARYLFGAESQSERDGFGEAATDDADHDDESKGPRILCFSPSKLLGQLIQKEMSKHRVQVDFETNIFRALVHVKEKLPKVVILSNEIPKNQIFSFLARLRHDLGIENMPMVMTVKETEAIETKIDDEDLEKLQALGVGEVMKVTDDEKDLEAAAESFASLANNRNTTIGKSFFDETLQERLDADQANETTREVGQYDRTLLQDKVVFKINGILSDYATRLLVTEINGDENKSLKIEIINVFPNILPVYLTPHRLIKLMPYMEFLYDTERDLRLTVVNKNQKEDLAAIMNQSRYFANVKVVDTVDEAMRLVGQLG